MTVKSKLREWFTLLCSVLSFLAGLSMVTQGGLYMFTLWDNYAATGLALFWFCFWECIALSWGYGAEHIYDHIEDILGRKINGWLKFCWKFITPLVILVCTFKDSFNEKIFCQKSEKKITIIWIFFQVLFIWCVIKYEKLKLNDYEYPIWAHLMGMSMGMISAVFVPLYFLYSLIIAPGNKMGMVRIWKKYIFICKYISKNFTSIIFHFAEVQKCHFLYIIWISWKEKFTAQPKNINWTWRNNCTRINSVSFKISLWFHTHKKCKCYLILCM